MAARVIHLDAVRVGANPSPVDGRITFFLWSWARHKMALTSVESIRPLHPSV